MGNSEELLQKDEGALQEDEDALSQLGALRDRLAAADPKFKAAVQLERAAEVFCDKVRTDLKAHRLALGLNQKELGKLIDFSQSAISKVENGGGDLSLKTLFRVAGALGLNPILSLASAAKDSEATHLSHADAAALADAVKRDLIREIPDIVQDAVARLVATD
jgi:transcriptional regulator with XRE-family HTH domain